MFEKSVSDHQTCRSLFQNNVTFLEWQPYYSSLEGYGFHQNKGKTYHKRGKAKGERGKRGKGGKPLI